MTVALISDIHGNLEALESVLEDIDGRGVSAVYCLGDVVGYGPDPAPCLHRVAEHCDIMLKGNHEQYAVDGIPEKQLSEMAQVSALWTREQLGDSERAIIDRFEVSRQLADILLVHASPFEPESWHYVLDEREAERAFESTDCDLCFFGHTHLPTTFAQIGDGSVRARIGHDFDPEPDIRYLINVGAVGQPRDRDPRACYVTFDTEQRAVQYHRVDYDIDATQGKMRRADLPGLLVDRLKVGQ